MTSPPRCRSPRSRRDLRRPRRADPRPPGTLGAVGSGIGAPANSKQRSPARLCDAPLPNSECSPVPGGEATCSQAGRKVAVCVGGSLRHPKLFRRAGTKAEVKPVLKRGRWSLSRHAMCSVAQAPSTPAMDADAMVAGSMSAPPSSRSADERHAQHPTTAPAVCKSALAAAERPVRLRRISGHMCAGAAVRALTISRTRGLRRRPARGPSSRCNLASSSVISGSAVVVRRQRERGGRAGVRRHVGWRSPGHPEPAGQCWSCLMADPIDQRPGESGAVVSCQDAGEQEWHHWLAPKPAQTGESKPCMAINSSAMTTKVSPKHQRPEERLRPNE